LGGFWAILAGFWSFENEANFEAEVGSRKSDFRNMKGRRESALAAPILIVEQSIIDS